jgi:virulence factor Mce-like protein
VRRVLVVGLLLVACAAAVVLTGQGGEGDRTYRVDALFYNAANLIPGQQVRIAGAEVGEVEDVKLTKDRRARVQMKIDERFGPFRADAKCRIRPQSLIGEKLVQCDPGSSKAPALEEKDGQAATVPVNRNEVPVDLDLVFASLRMPYHQRLSLIVNELGIGLAGRPKELNDAIRLANPALARTRNVLQIVDEDRAELGRLIDASDEVIAELARRRGQVQSFIDRAGVVSDEVASRRGAQV